MSIRDFVFGSPSSPAGGMPSQSQLGQIRREAIPTGGAYDPTDDLRFAAQEAGVPYEHLAGHAGTESAGGRSMVNPRSSASGPLQVIEGTFNDVSQRYYGGKLDWNSNRDKARAGARYYREQLDKYGDRATALGAYFVGPAKADELLQSGGKEGLMGYSVPGQGRPITVGEYVSKTTGEYEERGSGTTAPAAPAAVQRSSAWDKIIGSAAPTAIPEGDIGSGDFGRALAITAGDFAKAPVGALENLAGQLSGEGRTRTERSLADSQDALGGARRSIGQWQKGFFDSMSPEALDFAQREYTQLSGDRSMWQGGVKDFMTATALKGTLSLGPTIGPMVTTAILSRLGVGASASTLFGAQEGLMSAGLSAAGIADNIEQTPMEELRKVARFRELEGQLGEAEAKRQYTNEVQGVIPAITGLLVGTIAKGVGKPLDKIFGTGAGLPFGGRVAAGATVEGLQEGPQSFVEQVMQNYAEMAYNSNINLLDGAAESVVQGMLLGGIMGGTFAGMFGNRPQNRPLSSDPVPADIRAAIGAAEAVPTTPATPQNPAIGGGPPATGGGIPDGQPPPSSTPALDAFEQQPPEPQEDPQQELFGDNVLAPEVSIPPVEEALPPWPKNKAATPKLANTYGIPEFAMEQEAAAAAAKAAEEEANPLGLSPSQPVPTDVEAAVAALPSGQTQVKGAPKWKEGAGPVDVEGVLAKDAAKQKLAPSSLPPEPQEQLGFDVNQTREPKFGTRPRTEQLGYRVRMRGSNGEILSSELFETGTQARLKGHQLERSLRGTNDGRFVEVLPARRTFVNEQTPTAEPVSDVLAQIKDMRTSDPLSRRMDSDQRRAVYITRETLDNLREAGQLDQALRGGVPIRNFDTYGGVLLAADADVAQELMQLIEDPKSNIDEVIGYATGAGDGKPGGNNPVVQLLDADGNVIRERQVTPEEAEPTKAKWGPMARIMPLDQALAIRQNRMEREKAERGVAAEQQAFTATRPEQQVEDLFNENPITDTLAGEAKARAAQGGFEEDIGGRLEDLAIETRAEEKKRRTIDKRIPAPEDVTFRGREVVRRKQEETRLRREGKTEEADALRSSVAGETKQRTELSEAYGDLYKQLRDAALRTELARKLGSVQDVTEAETAYDALIEQLQAFYGVEGGYTKAEAVAQAVTRYSPKARRETIRAVAQRRDQRRAAADAKEEAEAEITRPARLRPGRIRTVGDEPREKRKLQNIIEEQKVSVSEMAAQLDRIKKRVRTPEGKRLVENLFLFLSPTVARDLDQIIDRIDASETIAKLDKMRAAGKLSDKRYEWRKKLAEARAERSEEKLRAATGTALIEIRQLLQQWLSDYRLALFQGAKENSSAAIHAVRAAETSEMLGRLAAWHQGDEAIADDAARYLAHRISTFVVHGKRRGVAEEMDIDGFWEAIAKGPMAFRDYLSDTVQSREELPFPTTLTTDELHKLSIGALNAYYVKAIEHIDGSRESDGLRRELVKGIKKAAAARGLKLSDTPETIEVRLWNRKTHDWVTVTRRISPRKLFAETFRRSYGIRGADSRMSMEQLKDLYLKGGEITVWQNGAVTLEGETYDYALPDQTTGPRSEARPLEGLSWADWIEGDFKGNGANVLLFVENRQSRKPFTQPKGKAKKIKLDPLGKELPEALPLNVRARRVTPEKKRRVIMSAVRAMQRKQYGGKSQSTGLVREATSDDPRARAKVKYSTGVLLEDSAPRDLGKRAAEYAELKERAAEVLGDALSNASQYLSEMETAKFKKAVGNPQGYVHAKAYINWVYEYGTSLSNANLKSWAAFKEMERVAADLLAFSKLTPDKLVAEIDSRYTAEMNEQLFRTVALDPVNLKGLRDPDQRAKITAESHDRLRKSIMFHKRLTEIWPTHPIFLQDIQPVLNKLAEPGAIRQRGMLDWKGSSIGGRQMVEVPTFTAEERKRVKDILEEWKGAKDLPLMDKGRLFQAWGVPADKLYNDFYLPLNEILKSAGFFDPDEALLKQYNRRYTSQEDQSTGPVAVIVAGENWKGQQETTVRYAPTGDADPVALAATEVERRNQERIDQQLLAMDEDEVSDDDTTITDRGVERPITEGDRKRRKSLISSPLGKTADSARKLLRANEIMDQFRRVLYNTDANARQIELAEARMISALREMGLWRDTGPNLGTIGLPDAAPILKKIEEEVAELEAARASIEGDTESTTSILDSKGAKEVERIAGELQASRDALDMVRGMQLGNKRARTIAYRRIGDRLVSGELTKEEARLAAGEKLTGFFVRAPKAERLGMEKAKTRGDQLKERAKAAAEEKKRREGMSYAQRKAAESYDRLGYGDLKFDISTQQSDYGKASEAEYETFFGLRDRLLRNPSTLGEVMDFLEVTLGADHKYQPLIRLLGKYSTHRTVPVRFSLDLPSNETGRLGLDKGSPVVYLNEESFMQAGFNPLRALHVVLHEATHAATVRAMTENQPATDALDMLRRIAKEQLGSKHSYATSDVFEFVAEAYSNPEFQRSLKAIKIDAVKNGSIWNQFVTWVRNLLGFDPQFDNLLDAVISLQNQTFGPKPYSPVTSRNAAKWQKEGFAIKDEIVSGFAGSAFAQHEVVQDAMRKAAATGDNIKEGGQSFLLKALSMRQLEQFYSRYFGAEGNPLKKYMQAFEERNSYASALLEEADRLSRRWTAIEEGKKEEGVELSRIMHDATTQGLHADQSSGEVLRPLQAKFNEAYAAKRLNDPSQKALETAVQNSAAQDALHARFRALSPEAQQLYRDVREYYKATQKREVQLMLANALRASKLWKGGEINAEDIDLEGIAKGDWLQQKLGIDLKAQKAKLAADAKTIDDKAFKAREADIENTEEELKLIARMANIPMMNDGPYFPLMRFGDYAVKAERIVASEVYSTRKERSEAMEKWQAKDPTLQFSFPKTDDEGSFPLTIKEVEFRLAETRSEAAQAREDMVAEYGESAVTPVQLKRDLISDGATIDSNRALQTLLGKLDGNAAAQAALREFYIKSLSDRSFRKREAKRKNIRGADPTKQHRTFGAYSKSASYYTSQLKYGHVMADAKADMQKAVEAHRDESEISAVRMGQIVREIKIRDDQAASLTDVSPMVRRAVETGQLWLLLSPSYWMINATQPWMVTTPWLAARSDMVTATKALAEAQSLIIDPLVTQGVQSWGGLKAIKSRLAAEQAFGVLENVEKALEKKLGKNAKPVLDMLTALKRESIIDLSFVAELRDIAEGQDKGAWDKVMDASRVLAHLTEVNNRIMTAIAAYNIAKQKPAKGRTAEEIEQDATDFAKRAVAETQFDYSAANKPRLFSANDAWWKPLVFQFMQYVQHMYVLFIRHAAMWWKSPRGSQDAKIGRRVVLGLLATHMAAGGILGATPQLAKWAIGLAMMAFGGGDDEDRTFQNFISGEYYNRVMTDAVSWLAGNGKVAEATRAGLPRLAGFDLSSRLAFLQTYMIDIDPKTSETLMGSLVMSFGGPMFGIAGNAFQAAQLALEGDADKAWEKLMPKLGRDAVRASRYWREGLVDNTGKTIVGADEMSPWEIFLTGMGFQPSQIAETYARNNRARESEAFVSRRKAEIMAAYRKARSTGETNSVMADLREFNQQFPKDRITMSQLLRGMRAMRDSERNIQRYGVDAGRRSAEYTDDSYNVE